MGLHAIATLDRSPPEIKEMNHTDWDVCKKCGVRMRANVVGWHFSQCQAPGRAIPEGKALCRKCGQHVKESSRWKHETHCRGSELANRTCRTCGEVFDPAPDGQVSRPMTNHELRCRGVQRSAAAKAAAAARAKAHGKAKAKAQAAAKAGAAPGPKAKAKVRAKAKPKPKVASGRGRGGGRSAAAKRAVRGRVRSSR